MRTLAILRTAVSSLGGNKLRTALTLLGIVIGVGAVITLMAIGKGAQAQVLSRIQSLGTNVLFVSPGSSSQGGVSQGQGSAATLTVADANALVDPVFAPDVKATAPQISAFAQLVAGANNTRAQVIGTTPDYSSIRNTPIGTGSFITAPDVWSNNSVIVLGSAVANTLFGSRDPVGSTVRVNGQQFTVIGVLQSQGGNGFGSVDQQVIVPVTTAYYRLSSRRSSTGNILVSSINVEADNANVMTQAQSEIETVLRLRHRLSTGTPDDFTISNQQDILSTLGSTTNTFIVFLGAIAGISLLVGGIGIMNIMLVSVTERTREIGIRKAMGAKRKHILLQFVSEATMLSIGGGAVGVALGAILVRLINNRSLGSSTFHTVFSGNIALLALVVAAAIGLFFGIYPALRAATLHPIEALRYE